MGWMSRAKFRRPGMHTERAGEDRTNYRVNKSHMSPPFWTSVIVLGYIKDALHEDQLRF
jgi:hypothetical protein